MLKKIFFIILSLNLLSNCDYKPVYSNQNKVDYKIVIMSFSGDKDINNLIATNLKRSSNGNLDKIINISFNTKYTRNILAKNSAGSITDYQTEVLTKIIIEKENNSESFSINEKFNYKKMTDKYEEKSCKFNITETNS